MSIDSGIITLVQEQRFQLMNEAGECHLYIVAADAPIKLQQLERLQHTGEPVHVRYRDAPGRIARVAERLVTT